MNCSRFVFSQHFLQYINLSSPKLADSRCCDLLVKTIPGYPLPYQVFRNLYFKIQRAHGIAQVVFAHPLPRLGQGSFRLSHLFLTGINGGKLE